MVISFLKSYHCPKLSKSENESELFGARADLYNQTDVLPQQKRLNRKSVVVCISLVPSFLSHRSSRSQDLALEMMSIPCRMAA